MRYIVQQFDNGSPEGETWRDVKTLDAADPGEALRVAVLDSPDHHIRATTYRVAEEALLVNVSINLDAR